MRSVYVSAEDLRSVISMAGAIAEVRQAFIGLARDEFDMPQRVVLGDGQFLIMSAHHRPTGSAVVKTLSLNFERAPAISGTLVWSELARVDHLVADAAAVTTLRTGAVVGVATDLLAPAAADRLVMIGAGAQAADQVRAVHCVRPLRELTVVDRDPARADALGLRLTSELPGVRIAAATDAEQAVEGADIVCCATTASEPLFRAEALAHRVHVNAIGSFRPDMRELPPQLLAEATVVVDQAEAALAEAGEVIHAVSNGLLKRGELIELGTALAADGPIAAPRTVFKTVGVAVQDWAVGCALARAKLG